jgi:hypothetical protein
MQLLVKSPGTLEALKKEISAISRVTLGLDTFSCLQH